jgi:hypothetical protein
VATLGLHKGNDGPVEHFVDWRVREEGRRKEEEGGGRRGKEEEGGGRRGREEAESGEG